MANAIFSQRLLPLPQNLGEIILDLYKEKGIGKRQLFDKATACELDQVIAGLRALGFSRRKRTKDIKLRRVKINDKTWQLLGEKAKEVGLNRTALLLVCLGRFLGTDIGE